MTYRVSYGAHPESLKSGRMVGPGDVLSEEEATENLQLIERGVVIEEPDTPKTEQPGIDAPEAKKNDGGDAGRKSPSGEKGGAR